MIHKHVVSNKTFCRGRLLRPSIVALMHCTQLYSSRVPFIYRVAYHSVCRKLFSIIPINFSIYNFHRQMLVRCVFRYILQFVYFFSQFKILLSINLNSRMQILHALPQTATLLEQTSSRNGERSLLPYFQQDQTFAANRRGVKGKRILFGEWWYRKRTRSLPSFFEDSSVASKRV